MEAAAARAAAGSREFGVDRCSDRLRMEAESVWRQAHMNSLASIAALRQALTRLAHVRGDKSVVFISGGMPLDEREDLTTLSMVAKEALEARATFFTIFIPSSPTSAARTRLVSRYSSDEQIHRWPLETIADLTGGSSFRADIGAEAVFSRLGRELSGYYRLGVERAAGDADAKAQRLKVQVLQTARPLPGAPPYSARACPRDGLTVRARELFDVRTIEDRNWTARLSDALVSPVPATGVALRMTSYVAADPAGSGQLTLMLTGEASRLRPGQATFQVAVRNIDGGEVVSTEQPLGDAAEDRLPFSMNLPVANGSYIVRFAVMDSTGRVGSVDHRVEARRVPVGSLTASGPLLVRVPGEPTAPSRLTLDGVRQDERLALQVDLEGERERPADADVVFEIAAARGRPRARDHRGRHHGGARCAHASRASVRRSPRAAARVLRGPREGEVGKHRAGRVAARLRGDRSAGTVAAHVHDQAAATTAMTASRDSAADAVARQRLAKPTSVKARAMETAGSFQAAHLLEPGVVGAYLDRLAVRPDVSSPEARALLERARTTALSDLAVSDALAAEAPVAAPFLRGLTLLAQGKLDPAAQAFRAAMRAGSDFYPAMVYLGACYAAGGQHKEAAGRLADRTDQRRRQRACSSAARGRAPANGTRRSRAASADPRA